MVVTRQQVLRWPAKPGGTQLREAKQEVVVGRVVVVAVELVVGAQSPWTPSSECRCIM
jgi:hypothetical protein